MRWNLSLYFFNSGTLVNSSGGDGRASMDVVCDSPDVDDDADDDLEVEEEADLYEGILGGSNSPSNSSSDISETEEHGDDKELGDLFKKLVDLELPCDDNETFVVRYGDVLELRASS